MLLGTLSVLSALTVFGAEETETQREPINAVDFFIYEYASEEEKIASMDLMAERFGYKLYSESLTGEVAIVNTKTGDILCDPQNEYKAINNEFPNPTMEMAIRPKNKGDEA